MILIKILIWEWSGRKWSGWKVILEWSWSRGCRSLSYHSGLPIIPCWSVSFSYRSEHQLLIIPCRSLSYHFPYRITFCRSLSYHFRLPGSVENDPQSQNHFLGDHSHILADHSHIIRAARSFPARSVSYQSRECIISCRSVSFSFRSVSLSGWSVSLSEPINITFCWSISLPCRSISLPCRSLSYRLPYRITLCWSLSYHSRGRITFLPISITSLPISIIPPRIILESISFSWHMRITSSRSFSYHFPYCIILCRSEYHFRPISIIFFRSVSFPSVSFWNQYHFSDTCVSLFADHSHIIPPRRVDHSHSRINFCRSLLI